MIENYNSSLNSNNRKSNKFITKILLSIILCFSSLIYIKQDEKNLENYKQYVFSNTFSFDKVNNVLNKYLDKNILNDTINDETAMVFDEVLETSKEKYANGTKLKYSNLNAVKLIESGIVVYVGEKENLGNTIIIQGIDGYDIWYSNISNSNIKIYDYLEKDFVIGETEELIVTISKDGQYIDYDEYIKEIWNK